MKKFKMHRPLCDYSEDILVYRIALAMQVPADLIARRVGEVSANNWAKPCVPPACDQTA